MNFLFMIGLRPTILVKTARIGQKSEELINTRLTRHLHFQILGRYRTLGSAIVTRLVLQSRNQRLDSDQRMARAGVSLFHKLAAFRDQTEVENRLKAEERSRFAKSLTRPTWETASMFHTLRMFAFRKGHASRRRPIHRRARFGVARETGVAVIHRRPGHSRRIL